MGKLLPGERWRIRPPPSTRWKERKEKARMKVLTSGKEDNFLCSQTFLRTKQLLSAASIKPVECVCELTQIS